MFSATRLACLTAVLAVGVSGAALAQRAKPAQQPAQPAQPAQQPAQPAQGAQPAQQNTGPIVVQVKPEPSQAEWTKVCGKDPATQGEICYTTRDFVSDQGQPVLAVALYDLKGAQSQKVIRFLLPLGLMLRPGIRLAVDQQTPVAGSYTMCFPNGCFAEATGLKDDFANALKKGTHINVSVQNAGLREVTFQVPLAGFAKAFDGAPIDPKVLEEQQKKLQAELEKKSEELRKRLEQQGQAGGTGTPAPATPTAPK